jgi:hypothetical protein
MVINNVTKKGLFIGIMVIIVLASVTPTIIGYAPNGSEIKLTDESEGGCNSLEKSTIYNDDSIHSFSKEEHGHHLAEKPSNAAGYRSDNDGDGMDDNYEDGLLNDFAPVVILHPGEDYYPTNVDWYLWGALLRFHHGNWCNDCPENDEESLPGYDYTQAKLIDMTHQKKNSGCDHIDDWERSWWDYDPDNCFFLRLINENDRYGSSDSQDWVVYGHVYWNDMDALNVQYWFFYAYSSGTAGFGQHEGDWESIIVEFIPDPIDPNYMIVKDVVFNRHNEAPEEILEENVIWYHDSCHPVVVSEKLGHASWWSYDSCHDFYGNWGQDRCYMCEDIDTYDNAWFTWPGGASGTSGKQGWGIINVGERNGELLGHINGQDFIHYSGNWGGKEPGQSWGPRGPAFQEEKWGYHMDIPYAGIEHLVSMYYDDRGENYITLRFEVLDYLPYDYQLAYSTVPFIGDMDQWFTAATGVYIYDDTGDPLWNWAPFSTHYLTIQGIENHLDYYISLRQKQDFGYQWEYTNICVETCPLHHTFDVYPDHGITIQQAVNQAHRNDTIVVHRGNYAEGSIYIDKPLRILGEDKKSVISWSNEHIFFIEGTTNVVISGFIFDDPNGDAILLYDSDSTFITENEFRNCDTGVKVIDPNGENYGHHQIKLNLFTSNEIGIEWDGRYSELSYNDFIGNEYGIKTGTASPSEEKGNRFFLNSFQGNSYGLYLYSAYEDRIYSNDFTTGSGQTGVFCEANCLYVSIYHNNFYGTAGTHAQNYDADIRWDLGPGFPNGGNYWQGHSCYGNPSSQQYHLYPVGADRYPYQNPTGWYHPPQGKWHHCQAP